MAKSKQTFDVVIVGGGIVGSACALAAAREGMRVALVEREILGGGATAAGMGHIVVMDDSEPQFKLTRRSQQLWQALSAELPSSAEYRTTGTLWVAADEEEMEEAARKSAYLQERSVASRLLDGHELATLEPNLRTGLAGAMLVPEDAVVYPPAVALHLARQAQALGARLQMGLAITSMAEGVVTLADGSTLCAPRLVNATGADAPSFTAGVNVRKRKGHLAITDRYPGFVRHQLVELGYLKSAHSVTTDSVAFNVQPRSTGQLLIGSSRQFGDEDSTVDQAMMTAMLNRAIGYLPGIARLSILRVWTGFRAATPDKLPLIGPVLSDPTLWLATGHEGLGITTALATAELLISAFTGRESAIPADVYLPARFEAKGAAAH